MPDAPRPLTRDFHALTGRRFDLLVIGGGINGTGVARDAARRGLSVALVERADFGYGTTGRSTRLIHGGLRYLAMYDFGLVRESLRERRRLIENAPHLVEPISFLVPFYEGQHTPPWKLKLGIALYDLLAGRSRVPRHQFLTRDQLLSLEPGLRAEGLRGGALYGDARVPLVERLCIENALDAATHGAVIVNHVEVERVLSDQGRFVGAVVRDTLDGARVAIEAERVVNTSGPWVDRVAGVRGVRTRMTKGAHLVTPAATRHAVLLFSPDDDRVFFSIPWLGLQLVGTTDTDYRGDPARVAADRDDVTYLQRGIRFALPQANVDTVHYTYAGLRNLAPEGDKRESDISRRHLLEDHTRHGLAGAVSLVGGKITPFRQTSEEVVDIACRDWTRQRSDTAHAPLPGAPDDMDTLIHELTTRCATLHVPEAAARTLATTYGTRAHHILDRIETNPQLAEATCPHAPLLAAEIAFTIETEMARTAADILIRRTAAGWLACEGRDALPRVLDILDTTLERAPDERRADEAAFYNELEARHAWRGGAR